MDKYVVNGAKVACTASVTRTLVQIRTPASIRAKILGLSVSFDGTTSSDIPVEVVLVRQTTDGTASSSTPAPLDPSAPASLVTGHDTFTVSPTDDVVLGRWLVTPNGGLFVVQFALGEEPVLPVSTRVGLTATAPSDDVNAVASITFET